MMVGLTANSILYHHTPVVTLKRIDEWARDENVRRQTDFKQ